MVSPEHIVVDTRRGRMVRRRVGRREIAVRPRPGGGTEQVTGRLAEAALPAAAVRQLVGVARDIERHFGRPQDIEWAWAHGNLFILQTRPITALPTPMRLPRLSVRFQRMTSAMLCEVLPVRPYPIDTTAWLVPLLGLLEKAAKATGMALPPPSRMFVEDGGVMVRVEMPWPRPTWRLLTAPVRLVRAARRHDPARWASDPLVGAMRRRAEELRRRDIARCSWPELMAPLKEGPQIAAPLLALRLRYFPRTQRHAVPGDAAAACDAAGAAGDGRPARRSRGTRRHGGRLPPGGRRRHRHGRRGLPRSDRRP
ncbi:hypothetical protein OHB39_39145 [Streptomyces sp. NBC_00047]|nr:PEP/pyruvate-binding domain-containing protein [Streptomyces sp. NBC_00047]MCX5613470.1 hypothetical protein [Streptomyces sp. NBC_00047]